jgi:error-prone DNA polymerase
LAESTAQRLVERRAAAAFVSVQDLAERVAPGARDLAALAASGALRSLAGHRHRAAWEAAGAEPPLPVLPQLRIAEGVPLLGAPGEGEDLIADYNSIGLTLGRHPLALLRRQLRRERVLSAIEVREVPAGRLLHTAGLVITRQRPGSAAGVIFVTLEDETGHTNLIVWQSVAERQRRVLLDARLLGVWGRVQRDGDVLHVIAGRLEDMSALLGGLRVRSRDFH